MTNRQVVISAAAVALTLGLGGTLFAQSLAPSINGATVAITGNATGTTGAVTGTLAAAANKVTYICGFEVDAIGGTAAVGPITLAGIVGSSMVFQGSSTAAGGVVARHNFTPCISANAIDSSITLTTTADSTATAVDVNVWGFDQ